MTRPVRKNVKSWDDCRRAFGDIESEMRVAPKNDLATYTAAPGVTDDRTKGFSVGSRVADTLTGINYLNTSDVKNGATWIKTPGGVPVIDTTSLVYGSGDSTKQVRIEADGITTGNTRVITMPDVDIDLTPGVDFADQDGYTTNTLLYADATGAITNGDSDANLGLSFDNASERSLTISNRGAGDALLKVFGNLQAGSGGVAADRTLTFAAATNTGILTWDEDPGVFLFDHAVDITGTLLTSGDIIANATRNLSDMSSWFNGTFLESFDATVASDGATITMSLEKAGGGDLTMIFSDGQTTLDCTGPVQTIALTAGLDDVPQKNYIYILQSGKILAKSTTEWPSAEHIRVGLFYVQSASLVNTAAAGNNWVLINHNLNDHASDTTTNQGHGQHITERVRREGASWESGAQGIATQDGNDLWVSVSAGVVFQMHPHAFAALDSDSAGAGDPIVVVNDPDANFTLINSLNSITKHSDGDLIGNNKYLKLVLFCVANKGGEVSPMMLNLPSEHYNTAHDARADVEGYANFTIPTVFSTDSSTGFLVAAFVCKHTATAMEIQETIDLRGTDPATAPGSGTGGGDVSALAALTDDAVLRGDGGAKDIQDSGVLIDDSDNITGVTTIDVSGNVTVGGTVDGVDIAALDAAVVKKVDFNAQTILAATVDDTPAALTVTEQTLVGRITAGNVTALSIAQCRTLLGVPGGSDTQISYNNGGVPGGASTFTYNDGTGDVTLTADNKFFCRDAGIFIQSPSDGNLLIEADVLVTIGKDGDGTFGGAGAVRAWKSHTTGNADLGSAANQWRDCWLDGTLETDAINIHIGGLTPSAGGPTLQGTTAATNNNDILIPIDYNGTTYYVPGWEAGSL